MIEIEVEIDENVADALDRALVRSGNLTTEMGEIARYLAAQTRLRFRTEKGPDGVPWKKSLRLTGYTKADGTKVPGVAGQTLTLKGDLRNSIRENWGANFAAAGPEASGGAAVYAKVHQDGARIEARRAKALTTPFGFRKSVTIPARPYVGWNAPVDGPAVIDILSGPLRDTLGAVPA